MVKLLYTVHLEKVFINLTCQLSPNLTWKILYFVIYVRVLPRPLHTSAADPKIIHQVLASRITRMTKARHTIVAVFRISTLFVRQQPASSSLTSIRSWSPNRYRLF